MKKILCLCGLLALTSMAMGATYTWNQTGTAAYNVAANWTPTRTTPAANDILIIDGTGTATPVITDLQTETIGELHVINNAYATVSAAAAITLTIAGDASSKDLEVAAGSTLKLTGGGAFIVTIALGATANGVVDGDVIFNATAASTPHRIISGQVDGLIFNSGATAAMAPTAGSALGGFGTASAPAATPNGVRFASGATYYQGGLKDGTRSAGTGSNPFALTQPSSAVVFDLGSRYVNLGGIPASSGRTYGYFHWRDGWGAVRNFGGGGTSLCTVLNDFIIDAPGGTLPSGSVSPGTISFTLAGAAALQVNGDMIIKAGGAPITDSAAPAAASTVDIKGNLIVEDPALFAPSTNANRVYRVNGATAQTVNFAGKTLSNLTIDNAAGVLLYDAVTLSGALDLVNGEVATSGTKILQANGTVARTNGFVTGKLGRAVNAATTGVTAFPVGTAGLYTPVSIDITAGGTGTGTVVASATAGDHPNVPIAANAVDRFWTLTPTGISGYTATLVFTYLDAELGGATEADLKAAGYDTVWTPYSTTIDTVLNTATATGVASLSDWTLMVAPASVSDWRLF